MSCSCTNRYPCLREIMTMYQKIHTLACTRNQLVATQTIFWLMEMGSQLLESKIISVLMVHTDGTIIWKPQSTVILYGKSSVFYLNLFIPVIIFLVIPFSEVKFEEAAVLHYTYARFSDLTSRRDRCGCKPTKEDVKRCFMLEFDRSVSSMLCLDLVKLFHLHYSIIKHMI